MAPSFDCAVSSLLCVEDNSVLDDNDYGDLVSEFEETKFSHRNHRTHNQNRNFLDAYWLPLQTDEFIASMVEREFHHLPSSDYLKRLRNGDLDLGARNEAVDWIQKVGSSVWAYVMSLMCCLCHPPFWLYLWDLRLLFEFFV